MMYCNWKGNWDITKDHFEKWWAGGGLVMTIGGAPTPAEPHDPKITDPGDVDSIEERYTNAQWRARSNHYALAHQTFPADNLPLAHTNIGPGSLAILIGSEPGFSEETVWFEPAFKNTKNVESLPPLEFDPNNKWWKRHVYEG